MRHARFAAHLLATVVGLTAVLGSGPSSTASAEALEAQGTPGISVRDGVIPGAYLVTLSDDVDPRGLARALRLSPRYVYSAAVNGFAADLTAGQLRALEQSADVLRVEQDRVVSAVNQTQGGDTVATAAVQQIVRGGGLYGLDRVDQRRLPLSGSYSYTATAPRVRAFVIDSGIDTSHPDFEGRAANVFDSFGQTGRDCNGHGTHVAGTIGGQRHGLAKDVLLRGVRVLDCGGSGSVSGVVAGVDWVRTHAAKPAVANLSLTGGFSATLNSAVSALATSGVSVAVAAGNSNANACNESPASAANVVTVAATDRADTRAAFSNYGACVDVYAPGVDVASTGLAGTTFTASGTSMSSPHVAGAMALYKASGDKSTTAVTRWIVSSATVSVVRANIGNTPNRLLFTAGL